MGILCLVAGFVLLVVGADKFVEGAKACATKLKIPPLIIGLTVVAFGTSAPELAVSVTAGLKHANEIALGNVVGSNIFNLLVVAGLSAVVAPLVLEQEVLSRDFIASILATLAMFGLLVFDRNLSRLDGLLLLVGFLLIIGMQVVAALRSKKADVLLETKQVPNLKIASYIIFGLVAIILGGQFAVDGATFIARMLGISETVIGLTVVAIGTSLPELVTSIVATKRGEVSIAIGNVIGSNLFNLLFILAVSVLCNPIEIQITAIYDTLFLFLVSLVVWVYVKKHTMGRVLGTMMIITYVLYTTWILIR